MAERRELALKDIANNYAEKFSILVRYMIVAAEDKRFVTYAELNKVLGVSIEDLSYFAGYLGDFCYENDFPYLNSLIINSTGGQPGENYYEWLEGTIADWGAEVAACFSEYHLSMSNKKRFENTSGMNDTVQQFLSLS